MSDSNIETAMLAHLKALAPSFPTAYPNVKFTATSGVAHQEVFMLRADNQNPFVGTTGPTLRRGIMQVKLKYPIGEGSGAALAKALTIQSHFDRGVVLTFGGTRVTIEQEPSIQPALPGADWYALPVNIPYRSYDNS